MLMVYYLDLFGDPNLSAMFPMIPEIMTIDDVDDSGRRG